MQDPGQARGVQGVTETAGAVQGVTATRGDRGCRGTDVADEGFGTSWKGVRKGK